MTQETTVDIDRRLRRLERANAALLGLCGLLAAGLLCGATGNNVASFDRLTVRHLQVVDNAGAVRAEFHGTDRDGSATFTMRSAAGDVRLLGVTDKDTGSLWVGRSAGRRVYLSSEGPLMMVQDFQGMGALTPGTVLLLDPDRKRAYHVTADGPSAAQYPVR